MRQVRREEPSFDDDGPRRRRGSSRPAPPQTRGRAGAGRRGPAWLPRIELTSPVAIATLGVLGFAAVAGLYEGGHVGLGPSEAQAKAPAAGAWMPVENVKAAGLVNAKRADLMKAIGVKPGDGMWGVDPHAIRERLEAMEWVDEARVAKLWPSTVRVEIVEKSPFAIWQIDQALWLVDRKGEPITRDGVEAFIGLPLVVGRGAPEKAAELVELLKRFPTVQRLVKAAVRMGERRWDLRLKSGIQVRLPEEGETDALIRLVTLDEKQKLLSRDIVLVDLRFSDRIIVKPSKGATEVIKGEDA